MLQHIRISRGCYSQIPGTWWYHSAVAVVDCVLVLASLASGFGAIIEFGANF